MSRIVWCLLLVYCTPDVVSSEKFSALQLFSKVILELADTNLVICPTAINQALAQVYLGAAGETEAELTDILNIGGTTKTEAMEAFQRKPRILNVISRMYLKNGYHILPTYQKISRKYFNIAADSMELGIKGANKINQWISSRTRGRFANLIDPSWLDDSTKVVLVNVVPFYSQWMFKMEMGAPGYFYMPSEKRSVPVEMMNLVAVLRHDFQKKLDSHLAILPYANSSLSMLLIVPRQAQGIQNLEDNLEHLSLVGLKPKRIHLSLPKFKVKYDQDMAQPLMDLGVKKIFEQADLSDLTKTKDTLRIDSIAHSVFFRVDEQGTRSLTAPGAQKTRSFGNPVAVTCNRPFLFAVLENTKIILFGRISRF